MVEIKLQEKKNENSFLHERVNVVAVLLLRGIRSNGISITGEYEYI